jgi:hypothetical protein
MTNEITPWKPSEFAGTDLLPINAGSRRNKTELVGRENVEETDLILPALRLLQGQSPPVVQGVPGAIPGKFIHSTNQMIFDAPLRVLVIAHTKSNALFPNANDPRSQGLERCISRDAVEGTVYGLCSECGRCTEWDGKQPPIGAQSHNLVVMTEHGPALLRFSRTSFQAAKAFITTWMMSDKNLWAHPVVVQVKKEPKVLKSGQQTVYCTAAPSWVQSEVTPPEVQAMALEWHKKVMAAHSSGRLSGEDERMGDDNPM